MTDCPVNFYLLLILQHPRRRRHRRHHRRRLRHHLLRWAKALAYLLGRKKDMVSVRPHPKYSSSPTMKNRAYLEIEVHRYQHLHRLHLPRIQGT